MDTIPQYRRIYEKKEELLPGENLAYMIKDIKRLPFKDFSEISSQDIDNGEIPEKEAEEKVNEEEEDDVTMEEK